MLLLLYYFLAANLKLSFLPESYLLQDKTCLSHQPTLNQKNVGTTVTVPGLSKGDVEP